MSFDFSAVSEFNTNETFTADQVVTDGGGYTLPPMKNAQFEVIDIARKDWDDGGINVNFSVEVANDGSDGSNNGRKGMISFKVAGFRDQDEKDKTEKRFKAFHAACGFNSLQMQDLSVFNLKKFNSDVTVWKADSGKEYNNWFYKKPQGGMGVPQAGGFNPQPAMQPQPMQQAQQQAPAFQPQSANMQPQQTAPQQQGQAMPDFMQQS